MARFFWSKKLFLFLFPIALLGQVLKKELTRLPYDELKKLYFDNEKDQTKQFGYANAYLIKAKIENNLVQSKRDYLSSLLYEKIKAISYLDSAIAYF